MEILLLGLGNDLFGDDAVGIWAARRVRQVLKDQADIVESPLSGVALLELFIGYDRAIVIDAIRTACHAPGTILELGPSDLESVAAPSPHYAGLPELFALGEQLQLQLPKEVKIFAVEVPGRCAIGEGLSESVDRALPEVIQRVCKQISFWLGKCSYA